MYEISHFVFRRCVYEILQQNSFIYEQQPLVRVTNKTMLKIST